MGKIRIVRKEGGTRVVSVTNVIPVDWQAVEMTVKKKGENVVSVSIEKVK